MEKKKSILGKICNEYSLKKEAKAVTIYSMKMGMLSWEFARDIMENKRDNDPDYELFARYVDMQQDENALVFENCDILPALFYDKKDIATIAPTLKCEITNILTRVSSLWNAEDSRAAVKKCKKFADKYLCGDMTKLADLSTSVENIKTALREYARNGDNAQSMELMNDIANAKIFTEFNRITNEMSDNVYRFYRSQKREKMLIEKYSDHNPFISVNCYNTMPLIK